MLGGKDFVFECGDAHLKICLLIPHYNHHLQFIAFLPKLKKSGLPLVAIDDGSDGESYRAISEALKEDADCYLHRLPQNRGKGAAASVGMTYARILGFTHVLQIDADGQHAVDDIEKFLDVAANYPDAIISGKPLFDSSAPKMRVYGRKVTDFWVALETLSTQVKDSLCGFRVYPLHQVETLIDHYHLGPRMDFDTEILVKAVWSGVPLKYVQTQVVYPEGNVSHFNYLRDNLDLIHLHVRLMLGMLIRMPVMIAKRIARLWGADKRNEDQSQ